jgi:hypothetical protein
MAQQAQAGPSKNPFKALLDKLEQNKRSKAVADSEIIHGQKPPPPPGAKARPKLYTEPPHMRSKKQKSGGTQ